jgi:hypothetical protein
MHFALMLLQQSPIDPEQAKHIAMMFLAIMPIVILVGMAIVIIPFWFICKKAGFSPWLSLINVIPLGNIILIYVLAFAEWKTPLVRRRRRGIRILIRRLRRRGEDGGIDSIEDNALASKRNTLIDG